MLRRSMATWIFWQQLPLATPRKKHQNHRPANDIEMGCRSRFVGPLGAQNGWSNDGQNLWELYRPEKPHSVLLLALLLHHKITSWNNISNKDRLWNIEYWILNWTSWTPKCRNYPVPHFRFTARRCHFFLDKSSPRPFPWNFAPPAVRDHVGFPWFPHVSPREILKKMAVVTGNDRPWESSNHPLFLAVASPSTVMRPERNMRLNCLAVWSSATNEDSVTGGLDPMESVQTRIRFQTIKMDVRNSHE